MQVEIKASWPRPHLEVCTMIVTLPQMCCVKKLKLHWNHSWTSSRFSERLSLVLKGKSKNCFTLSGDWNWKTFLLLLGKTSNEQLFKKNASLNRCRSWTQFQRCYHGSWVGLPGDVVISLQARNTITSQASDRRRARPKWGFRSNSEGDTALSALGLDT